MKNLGGGGATVNQPVGKGKLKRVQSKSTTAVPAASRLPSKNNQGSLSVLRSGARPGRLELPTLCLEATQYKTLSAASGVAYEEARHYLRP